MGICRLRCLYTVPTQLIDGIVEVLDANIQHPVPSNLHGVASNGDTFDGCIQIKGPMLRATIVKQRESKSSRSPRWNIVLVDPWQDFVENDGTEVDSLGDEGSYLRYKIKARIEWDDPTVKMMTEVASVCLVPFEISLLPDELGLNLEGLIQIPTYLKAGQFRRVRWFSVKDEWDGIKSEASCSDNSSLREASSEEIGVLDGCSQVAPTIDPQRHPTVTALEVSANIEEQKLWRWGSFPESSPARDGPRTRKLKKFMNNLTQTATQDDSYHNGVIKTTLLERYGEDMRDNYPQINALLGIAFIKFGIEREADQLNEELYEVCHGNGYFTFQIVQPLNNF
jgi:hypothetical protein